jgi:hypothetical protein
LLVVCNVDAGAVTVTSDDTCATQLAQVAASETQVVDLHDAVRSDKEDPSLVLV